MKPAIIPCLPHINAMASYALADLSVPDDQQPVMLAQNESLRPASPSAIAAGQQAFSQTQFYPDPDWLDLRSVISTVHKLEAEQILCGAGSMELISCLVQAYIGANDRVLTTQYAYAFIRTLTQITQANLAIAEEEDFTVSVDKLLAMADADTKLVFLANPGNPTGTRISRTELVRLREGLADDVLLIVDEAYGEFADELQEPVYDLVERGNTVVMRTFSKAYGLAGMRVGWGLFPRAIVGEVRKLLNPNNISIASQAAATAAMQDQAYMRETVRLTAEIREKFSGQMRSLGWDVPVSYTNFVLVDFGDVDTAQQVEQVLRAEGILVRAMGGYQLAHCVRITIGSEGDMDNTYRLLQQAGISRC